MRKDDEMMKVPDLAFGRVAEAMRFRLRAPSSKMRLDATLSDNI